MRSRISLVLALATALLLVPAGMAAAERLPKVEVCHVPPGNPANAHTINVSGNALPAHLRHGDFAVGEACSEGVGECRAEGSTQCDVADTCSAVPGEPSDEVCDGLDNDCDGVVDNDPTDLGECTAGIGECAVDDDTICTNGAIVCDAVPDPPLEDPETSCVDGRDNDCDGLIDERDPDCDIPCPCLNGGFCIQPGDSFCICLGDWSGDVCEVCDPTLCSESPEYYRDRFLSCMATDPRGFNNCTGWMGCSGELFIDDNFGVIEGTAEPNCF